MAIFVEFNTDLLESSSFEKATQDKDSRISLPNRTHPFHLVDGSSLPILVSFALLLVTSNLVVWMHQSYFTNMNGFQNLMISVLLLIIFLGFWFKNVILEKFLNYHTAAVVNGLKLGFALFIVSEVMFFFGFFWAYFYNALSPSIWIGGIWPPFAIEAFNPFSLPLANTGLLLSSGVTVTASHMFMEIFEFYRAKVNLLATLFFSGFFIYVQNYEFKNAPFSISDGIYGSTFYSITGLHGVHVIVGAIFLTICYSRYQKPTMTYNEILSLPFDLEMKAVNTGGHLFFYYTSLLGTGFITASWYWHFVDVVWIYVYIFLYLFSFF